MAEVLKNSQYSLFRKVQNSPLTFSALIWWESFFLAWLEERRGDDWAVAISLSPFVLIGWQDRLRGLPCRVSCLYISGTSYQQLAQNASNNPAEFTFYRVSDLYSFILLLKARFLGKPRQEIMVLMCRLDFSLWYTTHPLLHMELVDFKPQIRGALKTECYSSIIRVQRLAPIQCKGDTKRGFVTVGWVVCTAVMARRVREG